MSAASRGLIARLRLASISVPPPPYFHSSRTFTAAAAINDLESNAVRVLEASPRTIGDGSKRTGAIAVKCGMTALWDKWGARIPITVLWLYDNIVTQVKTPQKEGITALQIWMGEKKDKHLIKPEVWPFQSANGASEEEAEGVPGVGGRASSCWYTDHCPPCLLLLYSHGR